MKKIIGLLVLASFGVAFGQTPVPPQPAFPAKLPKKFVRQYLRTSKEDYKETVKNYTIVEDKQLNKYLSQLVDRLFRTASPEYRGFSIKGVVIEQPFDEQAFVYAHGQIIWSFSHICSASSEDVLAFVLSHEISHFVSQHNLYEGWLEQWQDTETSRLITPWAEDWWAKQIRETFANRLIQLKRDHEIEADWKGARMIVSAGFIISDVNELEVGFEESEVHMAPHERAVKAYKEMRSWAMNCPSCKAHEHPMPVWLIDKCRDGGYLK